MPSSKREIISVDPLHTAKTLILVYMCFSLPLVGSFFISEYIRTGELQFFDVLSGVIGNAVVGFIVLWLACKVYNWVAVKFGGIELDLKEIPEED
jgi:hypothetical protein